jgi:hypothetical protein
MRWFTIAATLLIATAAFGATIATGDLAIAPAPMCWGGGGCIATPPPPVTYLASPALQTKATLYGPYIVAFGPNGHLYAANWMDIAEYDSSVTIVRHITTPFGVASMTTAQNGDIYILTFNGQVAVLSPTGSVKQTFSIPFTTGSLTIPASFDLGADQCTLFYTDGAQTGRRFDVCTLQPLPDLAAGAWRAVRAMSDGGYIAADGSVLRIFNAQNQLLRTLSPQIDTTGPLVFDVDPNFVWVGGAIALVKVDLTNGTKVTGGTPSPLFLAVNGEQRPAAALTTDIPTLSPSLLAALAVGLILLASLRLRA